MVDFKSEIAKVIGQNLEELTEAEIRGMIEIPQDKKMVATVLFPLDAGPSIAILISFMMFLCFKNY